MYCWPKKNERLDLVEGLTPPKRKKKTAVRGGAGYLKAPAPTTTDRKRGNFIRVPLGTSAYKEGAVAMVGVVTATWKEKPQEETPSQKKKKTLQAQPLEEKER
jgi:hypothetical protein